LVKRKIDITERIKMGRWMEDGPESDEFEVEEMRFLLGVGQ
jgi:hypothetical protein